MPYQPREERPVTFVCEWCGQERTEDRPPGPTPRYCRGCFVEAHRGMNARKMREYRARLRAADPQARRPVGRPRTR